MFKGKIVEINGQRYAVTVPYYDFQKRKLFEEHPVRWGYSDKHPDYRRNAVFDSCDMKEGYEFITGETSVDYGTIRYFAQKNGHMNQGFPSHVAMFLPVFVPVNDENEYTPELLDDIEDGMIFPFCSAEITDEYGAQHLVSMKNKEPERYQLSNRAKSQNASLHFVDLVHTPKGKWDINVNKQDGVLVAMRPVVQMITVHDLIGLGYLQRDIPKAKEPIISWIDGFPWRVSVPWGYSAKPQLFGHIDFESTQYLDAILPLANKWGDFTILTRMSSIENQDSIGNYKTKVNLSMNQSDSATMSMFTRAKFFPEFVPLGTDGKPDASIFNGVKDGEIFELGTLYVNGIERAVPNDSTFAVGAEYQYLDGDDLKFGDTSFKQDCRIKAMRVDDRAIAIVPVATMSFWDIITTGICNYQDRKTEPAV